MKNSKLSKRLAAGCLAATVGLVAIGDQGLENLKVQGAGGIVWKTPVVTQKITRDEEITSLNGDGMKITAAKGETDSGQFIVNCDEKVTSYDVSVTDFTSGENIVSKDTVEICTQVYTFARERGPHDGVLEGGYYPDALIPVKYIKAMNEDVVEAGDNQGFWFTVKVPTDAAAGVYTATVTFTYNGSKTVQIPVTLTVYDFTIDAVPTFQSSFSIWEEWLYYGELNYSEEIYMNYFDTLLEYNITATVPSDTPEQYVEYLRKYYDKISSMRLPFKSITTTENDWEYQKKVIKLVIDACLEDEVNYFDKLFYRLSTFYDEYEMAEWRYNLVRPMIEKSEALEEEIIAEYEAEGKLLDDFGKEVAAELRDLDHHLTAYYNEEFADLPQILCPLYPNFYYTEDMEEVKRFQEENGNEWWSYGCVQSDFYPSPTWEINDFMQSTREMLWHNYTNDIVGNLFWAVNGYCNWGVSTEWGYQLFPDLYTTASHDNATNGDGYLLYPGAPYGSEDPFASIRLAVYRDGVDDHTYITQLARLYAGMDGYGEEYTTADAKGLVSFLDQQMTGRNASKLTENNVLTAKETIARAIEMAEKNGVVIDTLETTGNQIEYRFYAPEGVALSLNGQALTGTASGEGYRYEGSVAIPQSRTLTLSVDGETDGEIVVSTPPAVTYENGFATAEDLTKAVYIPTLKNSKDSAVLDQTNDGSNAKITLWGRNDDQQIIKGYEPKFGFKLTDFGVSLKDTWSIEFEIYNASDKDIPITVYLQGDSNAKVDYDKMILKAGEWRTVTVDNFNLVNLDEAKLADYQKYLMIRTGNLLSKGDEPYSVELLVDNIVVRAK